MVEKSVVDLIQRDLDGTLSPEEKLRLEREIASSPDSRRMHEELRAVKDVLGCIDEVNPPPTLKPSILREIQRRSAPVRARQSVLAPFRARPAVGYAVAVAGGIMVGIIGFALFSSLPANLDRNDVVGTLSVGGSVKGMTRGPELGITGEGVRGTVRTESSKDFELIHCSLESERPAEMVITFDPAKSGVVAIRNDQTKGTSILSREGEVRLSGVKGVHSTVLLSAPAGGGLSLHVSVSLGGALVVERDLVVGAVSAG
jgi:hypothetical protein